MTGNASNNTQARRRKAAKSAQQESRERPTQPPVTSSSDAQQPETQQIFVPRERTWLDPATWTGGYRYLPAILGFIIVALASIAVQYFDVGIETPTLEISSIEACAATFNHGFRINAAMQKAQTLAQSRAASGLVFESLMEILTPARTVFADHLSSSAEFTAFPNNHVPTLGRTLDPASTFALSRVSGKINTLEELFAAENNAALHAQALVSTPHTNASLGIAAILLAQKYRHGEYSSYARDLKTLLLELPRTKSGAITSASPVPSDLLSLQARDISFTAPFLAYFGVATDDLALVREAVNQISLYHSALHIRKGKGKGSWRREASFQPSKSSAEPAPDAPFSLDNALVAHALTRVLATITHWGPSNATLTAEKSQLESYITSLLSAALSAPAPTTIPTLLPNILNDPSSPAEISATALFVATAYRFAVLSPAAAATFPTLLQWAHAHRNATISHVDSNGLARPAVDPESYPTEPFTLASNSSHPFAQSAVIMQASAWRDCVCAGPAKPCLETYLAETGEQTSSFPARIPWQYTFAMRAKEEILKFFAFHGVDLPFLGDALDRQLAQSLGFSPAERIGEVLFGWEGGVDW